MTNRETELKALMLASLDGDAAACRLRAVDQESVSDPDILALAELLLEEPGQDGVGVVQQAQN